MSDNVEKFFNETAKFYDSKYKTNNSFYNYFFFERLNSIDKYFKFIYKTNVLDIGCGNCSLFYYLKKNIKKFKYFGNDISYEMININKNNINQIFVNEVHDAPFSIKQFNNFFMFGVSTYLTKNNFLSNLNFIKNHSEPNSLFFITVNNKKSIDLKIRNILRPFLQFFLKKSNLSKKYVLLSQKKINIYENYLISETLGDKFKLIETIKLNYTFFPFNLLLPKVSIYLVKFLKKSIFLKDYLFTDYMLIYKKID